ncbi:RibD family protein [Salinicola sp. LHM]|uniref:RibD family protein n=1 Tax=Salinicola TaxID=404432 RepID=UPI000A833778|nr:MULTISPECIES: RibD family protein [Salinicola]MDF3919145.1 RibD family protein [Salinicola salarius]MEC8918763.1 RibD family protein [Pseudomonadota bacterium]MED5499392.1 RibD family protein [Pseudomonadota bacterium]WQH31914.1 RibD family protein [Salinicola sp. LHM]
MTFSSRTPSSRTASARIPPVHTPQAWNWIRRAADLNRDGIFEGAVVDGRYRLDIDARGDWRCSHEVDEEAAQLLSIWLPWCMADITRGPRVIAQIGQSLDGRIATASGASHYVTGTQSLVHLHRLRALVDAVVVGAGTVDADDPQLTVRHVEGDSPLRVVLDPRGRVPADRGVFRQPAAPTWHLVGEGVAGHGGADHVSVKPVTPGPAGIDPAQVISLLAEHGHRRILIEGGGLTISRFLEADCLDRMHSVVAPMLIGSGRPALTLPEIETLDGALRPACRHFCLGQDMLFDLDLRDRGVT